MVQFAWSLTNNSVLPDLVQALFITADPDNNEERESCVSVLRLCHPRLMTLYLPPWQDLLDAIHHRRSNNLSRFVGNTELLCSEASASEEDLVISKTFLPCLRDLRLVFDFTEKCHYLADALDFGHFTRLQYLWLSFSGHNGGCEWELGEVEFTKAIAECVPLKACILELDHGARIALSLSEIVDQSQDCRLVCLCDANAIEGIRDKPQFHAVQSWLLVLEREEELEGGELWAKAIHIVDLQRQAGQL